MGERVYFTWPDRRLRYECRGCGACCKGHGIGVEAEQLVQLVARRPELAAFVRRRGDAITAFNPRDRCWFLADDGLCRVEVEDGRAAKPASCRLFPFNRVFRAGTWTIVDYNSVICPLAVVADGGVAHADVLAELDTIRDPAIVGTPIPPDDALIAREAELATAVFACSSVDAAWDAQTAGSARDTAAFEAVTGIAWSAPADPAAALAVTPSLRFNELYGPRKTAAVIVPRMWLAWLGFAALGERLAQRALGMQELTTIWSEQAPVMYALARWHDVPMLKPGPIELPPDPLVRTLAQSFVDNRRARKPLGELATAALGRAEPHARVAALKSADAILRAALVAATVAACGAPPAPAAPATTVAATCERAARALFPSDPVRVPTLAACEHDGWPSAVVQCLVDEVDADRDTCLVMLDRSRRQAYVERLHACTECETPDPATVFGIATLLNVESGDPLPPHFVGCYDLGDHADLYAPVIALPAGESRDWWIAQRKLAINRTCYANLATWSGTVLHCLHDAKTAPEIAACVAQLDPADRSKLAAALGEIDAQVAKLDAMRDPIGCDAVAAAYYPDEADSRTLMQDTCDRDRWSQLLRACVVASGTTCFDPDRSGIWAHPAAAAPARTSVSACAAYSSAIVRLTRCDRVAKSERAVLLESFESDRDDLDSNPRACKIGRYDVERALREAGC